MGEGETWRKPQTGRREEKRYLKLETVEILRGEVTGDRLKLLGMVAH